MRYSVTIACTPTPCNAAVLHNDSKSLDLRTNLYSTAIKNTYLDIHDIHYLKNILYCPTGCRSTVNALMFARDLFGENIIHVCLDNQQDLS